MERMIRMAQGVGLVGPAAVVLFLVLSYGINVPKADQWVFVDLVARLRAGADLWTELFAQHNEHRIVVPKLVMLGLASLTRWNVVAEMVVSVMLAAATLAVLIDLARPVLRQAGWASRAWLPFILSALVFSLAQWQNWLWGWQLAWFLAVFAAVSSIALATRGLRSARPWTSVAAAAAMAVICQYSLASGIAVWVATALVLAFHPDRWRIVPIWVALAAASSATYFIGYVTPAHHPTLLAALGQPLALVLYLGGYLSGPLGPDAGLGFAAAGAFAVLAGAALHRHRRQPERIMPWIAIGAFAVANAVMTGAGRAGFGPAHALESRYVTVALLLVVATVPLGILVLAGEPRQRISPRRLSGAAAAIVLTVLVIAADVGALANFAASGRAVAAGRDCLLRIDQASDDCLAALYPEPDVVRRLATPLRAFGWSTFAGPDAPPLPTIRLAGPNGIRAWRLEAYGGTFGRIDSVDVDADRLTIVGWARRPGGSGGPRPRILVAIDDVVVGEAMTFLERPDVAERLRDPGLARSGWMVTAGIRPQPGGLRRLRAYLAVDDRILVPLGGERTLPETS